MSRSGLALVSLLLGLVIAGCAGLAAGSDPDGDVEEPAAREQARPRAMPAPTEPPLRLDDLLGADGRLSVLILGSDRRKGIIGERTDAIIVATIDPGSGSVAMVSLPRDTVNVPIAADKAHASRINGLYWEYQRSSRTKHVALRKTRRAFEHAFDTEIDYAVLIDFKGLVRLVDSVGGVEVTLEEPFRDPTMHLGENGLRLKAGTTRLTGKEALAFARSRHSDSDYDRSRRQQQVLAAAAERVRERGIGALPALVELASKRVVTDIPPEAAPVLLELAGRARLGSPKSMVLAPSRWARPGPVAYTIVPRIIEIRKMFGRVFKPLS